MPEMAPKRSLCRLWSSVFPFCGVMSGFPVGTARGSSFTICQREEKKRLEVAEQGTWPSSVKARHKTAGQIQHLQGVGRCTHERRAYKRGGRRGTRGGEHRGGRGPKVRRQGKAAPRSTHLFSGPNTSPILSWPHPHFLPFWTH